MTSCIRVRCYAIIAGNDELRKSASSRRWKQYKPQLARCSYLLSHKNIPHIFETHRNTPQINNHTYQSCPPSTRARTPSTSPSRLRQTSTLAQTFRAAIPTQPTPSTVLASVTQVRSLRTHIRDRHADCLQHASLVSMSPQSTSSPVPQSQ